MAPPEQDDISLLKLSIIRQHKIYNKCSITPTEKDESNQDQKDKELNNSICKENNEENSKDIKEENKEDGLKDYDYYVERLKKKQEGVIEEQKEEQKETSFDPCSIFDKDMFLWDDLPQNLKNVPRRRLLATQNMAAQCVLFYERKLDSLCNNIMNCSQ